MRSLLLAAVFCLGGALADAQTVRSLDLSANHIVYDPHSQRLYASIAENAPSVASSPASVSVANGATQASVTISTHKVVSVQQVTITAAYRGTKQTATLTVTP